MKKCTSNAVRLPGCQGREIALRFDDSDVTSDGPAAWLRKRNQAYYGFKIHTTTGRDCEVIPIVNTINMCYPLAPEGAPMERPKSIFSPGLALRARTDLEALDQHGVVQKLRAIITASKLPAATVAEVLGVATETI